MGDLVKSTLDTVISKLGNLVNLLPAPILELYNDNKVVFFMVAASILALLAFEGYKLFKMLLFTGSAIGFGILGYSYLVPVIPANIKGMIPDVVDADVFVAILMALVAVFLCKIAQPLMIMIMGGICGYYIGSTAVYTLLIDSFNTLEFLRTDMFKHIVGGAIAAVMVLLFLLSFKHIYIVATSFGGAITAALMVQGILLPAADETIKICFVVLAVTLGIFAVTHQYKEEEKAMELVF